MKNNQKGVSIVETMISLGVFSVVMLVTGQMMMSTQKMSAITNSQREIREDNRKLDSILTYELRKAVYFYPKTSLSIKTIPQAVSDNPNIIRTVSSSNTLSPSDLSNTNIITNSDGTTVKLSETGNILTFFSLDKTVNVNSIQYINNPVKKLLLGVPTTSLLLPLIKNTTGNSSISGGLQILNKIVNDSKVQILKLNCLFLQKDSKNNSVDLVLYQQSGFYNASDVQLQDLFAYRIESNDGLLASVENIKNLVIDQINYSLNSKNYTSIKLPKDPFKQVSGGFTPPSIDFTGGTTGSNPIANSSFKVIAKNIGIKKGTTSLTYLGNQPTLPNDPRTDYKTNIDFSDSSNVSKINSISNPNDIGFRVNFEERDLINTVKISINSVKVKSLNSKPIYNHNEINIKPKISD